MRKTSFLLTMMLLAFLLPKANAQTVANYTCDFSGLVTTEHDFAPKFWGHIVDSYIDYEYGDESYVEYSAVKTGGVDNSEYLKIGSQTIGGWAGVTVKDMLVTPAVTGDVTLQVKKTGSNGTVKFYTCIKQEDGSFKAGSEYEIVLPELSDSEWTLVSLPAVPAGTYLGICGDQVGIDNFTAASAELMLRKELTIESVALTSNRNYLDANEQGKATISYDVVVKNSGDAELNPGDDNYSISVINYSNNNEVLGTVNIDQPLASGATSAVIPVVVEFAVTENSRCRYDIKENISGSSKFGDWLEAFPYSPNFVVFLSGRSDKFSAGSTIDFGMRNAPFTVSLDVANQGAAPSEITAIELPEGFSCKIVDNDASKTYSLPCKIPAHAKYQLDITMDAATAGDKSGKMAISVDGNIVEYKLSGNVLDSSKWYVNFEDQKYPDGSYLESTSWNIETYGVGGNNYQAENSIASEMTKFISPKLTVEAGEVLTFRANRRSSSAYASYKLNVYYSTDRKTWNLVKTISEDSEENIPNEKESEYPNPMKLKTFTVYGIPAGECYIAFEAGYVGIDDIYGFKVAPAADYDFVSEKLELANTATVNYEYIASLKFGNAGTKNIAENTFTANFIVNGSVVDSKSVPALERDSQNRNTSSSVSFSWTPRESGSIPVAIEITDGTYTYKEEQIVEVGGEQTLGYVAVGNPAGTDSSAPITPNYKMSDTEAVYTADLINLPAGTEIYKIMYRGYKTSEDKNLTLQVWVENTSDATPASVDANMVSTANMTKVYDGAYTLKNVGGSSADLKEMMVIDLSDNPFVYTGENIRIVVSARSDVYKSNYFEATDVAGMCVKRSADSGDLSAKSFSTAKLPLVNFFVEQPLYHIAGSVTNKTNSATVEGALVKLTSGNVEYSATTSATGEYSIDVYQNTKDYVLTVDKEGFFPYKEEKTVNVSTGSVDNHNIVIAEAVGFMITESHLPISGSVNSTYTATVKVLNGNKNIHGGYEASLYVNDEKVAEAESVNVEANASADFTFAYTPHEAGTVKAYVKFVAAGITTTTEAVDVVIAEEEAAGDVTVGNFANTFGYAPVNAFFNYSDAEIVYPASMIGLTAGSQIKSIAFKGYNEKGDRTVKVEAWIENTEDTEIVASLADLSSTANMTQIYNGEWTLKKSGSATEQFDLLKFDLSDAPFVYAGKNVRIIVRMSEIADSYKRVYFQEDVNHKCAMRNSDSGPLEGELSLSNMPVVHFGIDAYKTVSGKVTLADTQAPVVGEKVTVKSGDIEYYGTTDETGTYSVNVIKHSLDYVASVSCADYLPGSVNVSFASGNVSNADIVLEKGFVKGQVLDADTNEPIAGAYVELTNANLEVVGSATTADGSFEFPVGAGVYDLWGSMDGYQFAFADAAEVTTAGVVANVYLRARSFAVAGVINDEKGNVLTDVTVTLKKDGTTVSEITNGSEAGDYYFENITHVNTHVYTVEAKKSGYLVESITLDFSSVGQWDYLLMDQNITLKVDQQGGVDSVSAEGFKAFGGNNLITVVSPRGVVNVYNEAGALVRSVSVEEGKTAIYGFNAGVYIVNGIKVVVR